MDYNVQTLRNRVVKGWAFRDHSIQEQDNIGYYLIYGDPKFLPQMYKANHEHWFPEHKVSTVHKRLVIFMAKGKKVAFWAKEKKNG